MINSLDLNWTRFGSVISLRKYKNNNKDEKEEKTVPPQHLDISDWLKVLELKQYEENFSEFSGVEELLGYSESEIRDLGVKISSHRSRIMTSLTALKAKYRGDYAKKKYHNRHSVAVDNRKKIQEADEISDLKTVYEAIQSKSLNNLIMEPCADAAADPVALKKALEWELSLDSRDIRSHAWYHGAIPRSRAEEIVKEEGGFLVRDCTSQPGNFVLTCRTKIPLHFVINKQILQPDTVYERVQYQFEDEAFDTVADLITSYVGSGRPITAASGARIQFPKNRMYPLSFYATKYPAPMNSRLTSPATTPSANMHFRYNCMQTKQSPSPTRLSKENPPRLPSKKQRSQSLTPSEVNRVTQEKCSSADGVIQSPLMTRSTGSESVNSGLKFSTQSLPRPSGARLTISHSSSTLGKNTKLLRSNTDSPLSPCAERRLCPEDTSFSSIESPPPKPCKLPSILRTDSKEYDPVDNKSFDGTFLQHGTLQRVTSYHASGSDSGNGSGDSALSSAAGDSLEPPPRSGVIIKNPRYNLVNSESSTTLKNFEFDYIAIEEKLQEMPLPELRLQSRFDLDNFSTILLPVNENKPLDSQALRGIKIILKDSGSRILANHLTKMDLDLVFGGEYDEKYGSGISLCTLPHGYYYRQDLIERTECLKLLVAVTILTCPDEDDRVELLNKWIEVAIDTKTALGNLFGFCGIMLGLCLPQVENLVSTWHCLRQKYTDAAFTFEAKLRPTLKSMNNCSNPQAPNTTIPHLLPYILLIERGLDDFVTPNEQDSLSANCLGPWETNTQDFGLSTLLAHLEMTRKFIALTSTFQRNAEIVLGEARTEELTLDMFKTEFHLKFLWGSRGAYASPRERHVKFEQLLTVMAEKCCNVQSEH